MQNSSQKIIEFTLVYNQHKNALFNFTLKMVSNRMVCEDIVQNVFVKLFENLEKIRNANGVRSWLFTTARNEIYTFYRNKKIHIDQYGVEDSDELDLENSVKMEDEFEIRETSEIVLSSLNALPVEQKEVFLLKEYGGFSYKEISTIMNIDENLVKSRLFKTRQKLISKLSKIFSA